MTQETTELLLTNARFRNAMIRTNGVRFRAVVAKIGGGTTNVSTSLPSHTNSSDQIITFYSDRNLKDRMKFLNPQVEQYYQSNQHTRRKP